MGAYDPCPRLITRREEEEQEEDEDGEWVTSFCGCLANPPICCLTCVCPCIAMGLVAEKLDRGSTHWLTAALVWLVLEAWTTCGCLYACHYRAKLRRMYNLPNEPLPDSLAHWICFPCAICQELRELKARETVYYGFDDDQITRYVAPPWQVMDRD